MSARRIAIASIALVLSLMGAAGTANAATHDNGVCESGEMCLWYNSYYKGGVWDSYWSDAEYTSADVFHGTGGQINNNSASVRNRDATHNTIHYQYYNWTGWAFLVLIAGDPQDRLTLPSEYKNQFSSFQFSAIG
ncbi:peptidase inhibitor family I36 protein [Streptomyces sp. NPDC050085]|uniref:peptidase inhibitor family I36 protein n=1 Tax=Streptomyces sp. NPDC050085 TaxID=3365600 RepID=UPI003793A0F1